MCVWQIGPFTPPPVTWKDAGHGKGAEAAVATDPTEANEAVEDMAPGRASGDSVWVSLGGPGQTSKLSSYH